MKFDSNDLAKLPDLDIEIHLAEAWGHPHHRFSRSCVNAYRLGAASWDETLNEQESEIARLRELVNRFMRDHNAVRPP